MSNCIEREIYDSKGELAGKSLYKYNDSRNLIESIEYDSEGESVQATGFRVSQKVYDNIMS